MAWSALFKHSTENLGGFYNSTRLMVLVLPWQVHLGRAKLWDKTTNGDHWSCQIQGNARRKKKTKKNVKKWVTTWLHCHTRADKNNPEAVDHNSPPQQPLNCNKSAEDAKDQKEGRMNDKSGQRISEYCRSRIREKWWFRGRRESGSRLGTQLAVTRAPTVTPWGQ